MSFDEQLCLSFLRPDGWRDVLEVGRVLDHLLTHAVHCLSQVANDPCSPRLSASRAARSRPPLSSLDLNS